MTPVCFCLGETGVATAALRNLCVGLGASLNTSRKTRVNQLQCLLPVTTAVL